MAADDGGAAAVAGAPSSSSSSAAAAASATAEGNSSGSSSSSLLLAGGQGPATSVQGKGDALGTPAQSAEMDARGKNRDGGEDIYMEEDVHEEEEGEGDQERPAGKGKAAAAAAVAARRYVCRVLWVEGQSIDWLFRRLIHPSMHRSIRPTGRSTNATLILIPTHPPTQPPCPQEEGRLGRGPQGLCAQAQGRESGGRRGAGEGQSLFCGRCFFGCGPVVDECTL